MILLDVEQHMLHQIIIDEWCIEATVAKGGNWLHAKNMGHPNKLRQ
jgi:hypothetical protein